VADRVEGQFHLDWWANSVTLLASVEIAVAIAVADTDWTAEGHLIDERFALTECTGPAHRPISGRALSAAETNFGPTGRLSLMSPIKVTYDEVANASYIYLQPPGTRSTYRYPCDPVEVGGMINLDFDAAGRLIGLEVLDARAKLAPELLARAEDIAQRPADGH
jgi:uncharacterized protein YuzE